MGTHLCPWYLAYTFDNPIRKLIHKPEKALGEFIKPGFTTMDLGCGMGHFSLGMARMVGASGKVYAVDLQSKMLEVLRKRARRNGLESIIETRKVGKKELGSYDPVDFILACWMIHEIPDKERLFSELAGIIKDDGKLLIAEPKFHVKEKDLDKSVEIAEAKGFKVMGKPKLGFSYTALLALG